MPSVLRILIKTHHMTSRKKIMSITQASRRLSCAVILKTGGPPGIMVAEGEEENGLAWLEHVRKLRYKDYRLMKNEMVLETMADVGVEKGEVREVKSVKELGALLEGNGELHEWWRMGMGYKKE